MPSPPRCADTAPVTGPVTRTTRAFSAGSWTPGQPSPAFGHGRHSCPAQPFSLAAMTAAMKRLLREYQMTPGWTTHPQPVPAQIGGVARAEGRCLVDYIPRSTASKTPSAC
jgi:hypothetical protein